MNEQIEFTRIDNDINGNPRYVCHFLNLVPDIATNFDTGMTTSKKYEIAVKRANKIGGRKYHNRQYGGGIVFQSYNLDDLRDDIARIIAQSAK